MSVQKVAEMSNFATFCIQRTNKTKTNNYE